MVQQLLQQLHQKLLQLLQQMSVKAKQWWLAIIKGWGSWEMVSKVERHSGGNWRERAKDTRNVFTVCSRRLATPTVCPEEQTEYTNNAAREMGQRSENSEL